MKRPAFRRRMVQEGCRSTSGWRPIINTGCIVKMSETGEILDVMWDFGGENHPMITSMREHRGWLYIGGIHNNRIGRLKLDAAAPDFVDLKVSHA
jgi:ribose transport system permease protein